MRRLYKPVRASARPGVSRVRRVAATGRGRKLHRGAAPQDLSGLVLYGQG
jgi:hypothetical protein